MAARNQQQQIGKRNAVGETCGQRMRFEVIDRDKGLLRQAIPLAAIVPTIKPPISPASGGGGPVDPWRLSPAS
jgi:hypothetical protein